MLRFLFVLGLSVFLLETVSYGVLSLGIVDGESSGIDDEQAAIEEETRAFFAEYDTYKSYTYEAFIGWRSAQKEGAVINVTDEGLRLTKPANDDAETSIYFFGGSTIWGFGVSDEHTIPSLFARRNDSSRVYNMGEQAYNSRQSINYLMQRWDDIEPGATIVFYDGVNDAIHSCESKNGPHGHGRTDFIRQSVREKNEASIFRLAAKRAYMALVTHSAAFELARAISTHSPQEDQGRPNACLDDAYAWKVASTLANSWKFAHRLADAKNLTFHAILQPTPYHNDNNPYDYKYYKDAYEAIYPKVLSLMVNASYFTDASLWLKEETNVFTDWCCHLNARGNELIVLGIEEILEDKTAGRERYDYVHDRHQRRQTKDFLVNNQP